MMENERFNRLLGLATRAGKAIAGEGKVADFIKRKDAYLVIISEDASENTKKKFKNSCSFYSIDAIEYGDRYTLGRYTGRTFAVVIAISDNNLAMGMRNALENMDENI